MTEQSSDKPVEQYLAILKTLLGGTLPEKIQPNTPPASVSAAHAKAEREKSEPAASSQSESERAPLLYPPMTAITVPVQQPALADHTKREIVAHSTTKGAVDHDGVRYCPLLAVVKFPYKYVGHEYRQAVASALFDGGKVWDREWKLYFIWCHEAAINGAVIFIEEAQLLTLIDEINTAFPALGWVMHKGNEDDGLVMSFPYAKEGLAPQYLGISHSREEYEQLCDSIDRSVSIQTSVHDKAVLADFYDLVELASNAAKNKSKASKMRKDANMIAKAHQLAKQLTSAREYVGFRADQPELSTTAASSSTSPPENSLHIARELVGNVILVAIDCEAYERDHSKITEVGIATLDTGGLLKLPIGKCAETWRGRIRSHHYRIAEHRHLVNKDFIKGCADGFEFGTSEIVSITRMASVLASCFKAAAQVEEHSITRDSGTQELRKIVLVGHDISQDITYCHALGFSILNRSNLVEVLDTSSMFRSYSGDVSPRSLASVLHHFDITAWNLHNAGNDAAYTLWVLLAMCVEPYTASGHHNEA